MIVPLNEPKSPSECFKNKNKTKKGRTTLNSIIRAEEPSIAKLTFFTEALNAVALPGSVDLISHLLQALSSVVQTFSSLQADVSYTEQLLMSAIDSVAGKVTVSRSLLISSEIQPHHG